jgi:hypothetical protein
LNFRRGYSSILLKTKKTGASDLSGKPYEKPAVRVAISSIVAALYATMVIVFWVFGFGPAQIRIADCLMPLAFVFGYAGVLGVSIGCIVGNYYGFATSATVAFDVIGGPVANFLAAFLGYKVFMMFVNRGKRGLLWVQIAILVENVVVTFIVGSYMAVLIPLGSDLLSSIVVWYAGVFLGSLVTMNGMGYLVYKTTYIGIL